MTTETNTDFLAELLAHTDTDTNAYDAEAEAAAFVEQLKAREAARKAAVPGSYDDYMYRASGPECVPGSAAFVDIHDWAVRTIREGASGPVDLYAELTHAERGGWHTGASAHANQKAIYTYRRAGTGLPHLRRRAKIALVVLLTLEDRRRSGI